MAYGLKASSCDPLNKLNIQNRKQLLLLYCEQLFSLSSFNFSNFSSAVNISDIFIIIKNIILLENIDYVFMSTIIMSFYCFVKISSKVFTQSDYVFVTILSSPSHRPVKISSTKVCFFVTIFSIFCIPSSSSRFFRSTFLNTV